MKAIGIDFGTTKTLVSYWDTKLGRPRTARLGEEKDKIPTVIHVGEDGCIVYGEEAEQQGILSPEGYVVSIKRGLGEEESAQRLIYGRFYKRKDLIARFLGHIKQKVENEVFLGEQVTTATLTVPALFTEAARDELLAAAESVFSEVDLLDEPTAAGLAFLHEIGGEGLPEHIAVFDWGGGTLDIAVMENAGGQYKPLPDLIGGDVALGGEDIDELLFDEISRRGQLGGNELDESGVFRLKKVVRERIKHQFTNREKWQAKWKFQPGWEIVYDRREFEATVGATLDQAIDALKRVLDKASEIRLESILYVGGSSKLGGLPEAVEKATGLKGVDWHLGDEAVCLGAAYHLQVNVDDNAATAVYREAAESGDAEAQFRLGTCYATGKHAAKDMDLAYWWFSKAAEQRHAEAQLHLGILYHEGSGVTKNTEKAAKWFTKSAKQGCAEAQYQLSQCYYDGLGVPKDLTKAFEWSSQSADQNHPDAAYCVARCFREGKGVDQNLYKAVQWCHKASELGNVTARRELQTFKQDLKKQELYETLGGAAIIAGLVGALLAIVTIAVLAYFYYPVLFWLGLGCGLLLFAHASKQDGYNVLSFVFGYGGSICVIKAALLWLGCSPC